MLPISKSRRSDSRVPPRPQYSRATGKGRCEGLRFPGRTGRWSRRGRHPACPGIKPLRPAPVQNLIVRPPEGVGVNLLTDKPTGSVIDVTLSWPAPPDSRLWRYVDRLLMVLFLCGLAWT